MLSFGSVVLAGLAFDWALYSRLTGILAQNYIANDGYFTFLFPRVLVTLLSLVLIGHSIGEGRSNFMIIAVGSVLFAGSNFYAVYRFYRGDEIES